MSTNLEPSLHFLSPAQTAGELGRLGSYRVLKVLGRGGMGVVFLAEDPQLQRTVALKAMLPEVANKAIAKERFLREARATAKIEHDHIVTIFQVGEERGIPYLAMQLLKGMTLEDFLKKKHGKSGMAPSLEQILKIGREIARGLAAAHEKGMIHRDIKPANIWLDATAGGRVKILDFGLARAAEGDTRRLTVIGAVVGTAAYMAPEQARSDNIDGRADLFSLGCILYRLCTGRQPWKGGDAMETLVAVSTEEAVPVQELNPNIPPRLAQLVMRLLAKKPDDRPASAKVVAEAIQAIEREQPTTQMKATLPVAQTAPATSNVWHDPTEATGMLVRPTALKRRPRRRPWLVAGVLATAIVLAAVGVLALLPSTGTATSSKPKQLAVVANEPPTFPKQAITHPKFPDTRLKDTGSRPKDPEPRPKEPDPKPKDPDPRRKDPDPKPKDPDPKPEGSKQIVNSINMKLNLIPAGTFRMGASADDIERVRVAPFKGYMSPGWEKDASPQHEVRLTKSFYMGTFAVTQGQYEKVMGRNPSFNKESPEHPVETINWQEAMEFCKRLSELPEEKMAGRVYRLPTEAEWEYACRAGTTTAFHYGQSLSTKQANINGDHPLGTAAEKGPSVGKTVKVGSYQPNAFGLYDMHGNVWNWCLDGQRAYTAKAVDDPRGPETAGAPRAMRGGAWREGPVLAAFRKSREPTQYRGNYLGFRVICERP